MSDVSFDTAVNLRVRYPRCRASLAPGKSRNGVYSWAFRPTRALDDKPRYKKRGGPDNSRPQITCAMRIRNLYGDEACCKQALLACNLIFHGEVEEEEEEGEAFVE